MAKTVTWDSNRLAYLAGAQADVSGNRFTSVNGDTLDLSVASYQQSLWTVEVLTHLIAVGEMQIQPSGGAFDFVYGGLLPQARADLATRVGGASMVNLALAAARDKDIGTRYSADWIQTNIPIWSTEQVWSVARYVLHVLNRFDDNNFEDDFSLLVQTFFEELSATLSGRASLQGF